MKYDVVGLGVCTMDLLMVVDELPGGELVQRAHASALAGGGPVATALVALARLGARAAMLDLVGGDLIGRMILTELGAEGVDTAGMVIDAGSTSSQASVLVRKGDGARAIAFAPGSSGELSPRMMNETMIRSARILHLNGRHWQACLAAARVARDAGVLVSFDGGSHRFRPEHRELLPLVDICIVAQEYAASCTGNSSPEVAAEALLGYGPQLVAVTSGTLGSFILSYGGEAFHQPAYEMEGVVDTTGAGDAYHGGFLFAVARGLSLEDSARYASAAGALNTRALGGRAALPTLAELESFIAARG
ncbi:carbohydrate kinase [Geomonas subterranea]|uniref:Carbohydrate kinase n=1 Tax=Geomonas subterranea TaxID=2847989 RepID=A0ABX8LJL3_9BACT|nr:PfkB family carbohydrate kinase [Geomonas subterranea]QXE92225.1 carbohydrate kinase [Geomonas subterranea]QXM09676.1 carbohydrate kinase [Geomonas subterranea]